MTQASGKTMKKTLAKPAPSNDAPLTEAVSAAAPKPAARRVRAATATAKAPATRKAAPATDAPSAPATPEAKPAKVKKTKLVRDSFTMPAAEYAAIAALKKRCLDAGVAAKKSEILRAAILGFARLGDAKVVAAIRGLDAIKTGRPAKGAK